MTAAAEIPAPGGAERRLLGWLWRAYLSRERALLAAAMLLMALEGATLGLFAAAMEPLFDRVFVGGEPQAIGLVAVAVAGIFVLRAAASALQRVTLAQATERTAARLQHDLLAHLMRLDGGWHQRHPPGYLIERVQGDVAAVSQSWATVLTGVGRDAVALVSLLAVAVAVDPLWTLVALVGLPLLALPAALAQGFVQRRAAAAREIAARMATRLDEVFHGLAAVKLNGIEGWMTRRYDDLLARRVRAEVRGAAGRAAIPALVDLMTGVGFVAVLLYGGAQIADGSKTVGQFMAFFTAMALAFEPVRRLAGLSGVWSQAAAGVARIRAILEERPRLRPPARPVPPPPGAPEIVLRDVHLQLGGHRVLDGLSLTAPAGRTTALVGPSGAGKSTVFALLGRLLEPDAGEVLVGGVPVSALDPAALRGLFSVVAQDALLFDETIRDNLLLGGPPVEDSRLAAALEASGVAEFLPHLPLGLDTPAGPRGSALSGGQRQRVAIARALLRDAPVLLLDEATSALDPATERRVQGALRALSAGRTAIVIAHRLHTVREADRIVVLDRGRAVETGTHDALIAGGGLYARLHHMAERGTAVPGALVAPD
ncbi:ABC transporter ATP-binding protein [Rubellimicrobium sp. CFH 75288]|uniref:ABC transporter ATP-binding protein n=1 Tax=Rubellimicrobium sp. CFH 75288 TaxID=2697034 RepID=UPI001FB85118|nr:ABC transporter ATP-binding protein [Rubellimicrobium sp. CFH 75288]